MASKCTISFDNNPYGIYYAGQLVSGTAELITTRPKTIRSIQITVSGFADVRWTENVTKTDTHGKSQKAIETFSSSEIYYSSEKYVYGQSNGAQLELPVGKYAFTFQATIPPNAPTSFNGACGQIQHEVSLVIDRVMRYNNIFKQAFSVISPYDLNLNPENAKPLHKIEEQTFWLSYCCGNREPMIMNVTVPFSSYAPGQKIRFNIVLDNRSDVNCKDVKVRLMKKVLYTSRSPESKKQTTEVKIADNHCGEVVKLNKAQLNEFLQIPSTTPSSLESCSIIKVSYSLKFIAKTSSLYSDLIIEFPLNIGTVPLYASANDQAAITAHPGNPPIYKPLPPPTFEEDLRSEQFESNTFKPRYPVFLCDANLSGSGGTTNKPLYPSPHINPDQAPVLAPTQIPSSIPHGQPTAPSSPSSSLITSPSRKPSQPNPPYPLAQQQQKQHNTHKAQAPNVEVLGFSIPPDYEPTPSAPPEWK